MVIEGSGRPARANAELRDMRSTRGTFERLPVSAESAFGACCLSVASLAWSLAVAGMPGRREGVFRVLAGVSGIGGECFSWMGGGQQGGDRVAAHLDAGHAGGNTTRTCQWSQDSIMAPQEVAAALKLAPRSGPARRAAPLALPRCSWWPGNLVELRVVAPQNPHKSGSAA